MKKIIISLILASFLLAPVLTCLPAGTVSAETPPSRNELLIQMINKLIKQLKKELAELSIQQNIASISTPNISK